jgi:hypothetical protein
MLGALQKAVWVAAFAIVATFWIAMALKSSQQVPPHKYEQLTKTKNRQPPQSVSVVEQNATQNGKKRDNESHWYDHVTDWLLVAFNGLLVLATIGLFISARKAADAAKNSADVARQALVGTQRAFVFIKTFEVLVINQEIQILPQWENSGSTPAKKAKNYANWKTFIGEIPHDYSYPDIGENGNPLPSPGEGVEFFIGPKSLKYADILKVPLSTMEAVRAHFQRLFVWGWITYDDEFGQNHRTEVCNEVVVTGIDQEDGKVTVALNFRDYGPHNTAR